MLYLYFEIKRLPRTHIFHFSNTKLIHLFLLFFFIGSSPKNRILCIEILFLGSATLVQRAATHLSAIFHDIFSTTEKDTTKSLGLSRLQSNREEISANGETKWWQISKTSQKNRFSSDSKNSSGERLCLICRFG